MSFSPRDLAVPCAASGPVLEWEETDCLLCGGRRWSLLVEAPDTTTGGTGLWFAVVQCHECGLCFTNPRPTLETIAQFYPDVYRPHHTTAKRKPRWRLRLPLPWRQYGKDYPMIPMHGRGRLLDFGCGGGTYMARMKRLGWDVTGVDTSESAIRRVRAEPGLRGLVGTLPHPQLDPGSFDVITMWHSLEHVHSPLTVLREARRLLAPGGKLAIAVPNIDSSPFRWFGRSWYGLDLPRHLTHFTPWTLRLILERADFDVGPIRMLRHSDWMRWSAKIASRTREQASRYYWLSAKPASRLASWYTYLTRQADCMLVMATR
jgi:2-polyprenyl-3-methyl-5-hydroxy-6-metoxy-1,4-benzoquinol methylase